LWLDCYECQGALMEIAFQFLAVPLVNALKEKFVSFKICHVEKVTTSFLDKSDVDYITFGVFENCECEVPDQDVKLTALQLSTDHSLSIEVDLRRHKIVILRMFLPELYLPSYVSTPKKAAELAATTETEVAVEKTGVMSNIRNQNKDAMESAAEKALAKLSDPCVEDSMDAYGNLWRSYLSQMRSVTFM
ncbi:hypothetical protein Tco_0240907, partial [Tanacetum coccineum]